jgi:hypothetical protein
VKPSIAGSVLALVASAGFMAPTAYGDGPVVLGGGAGITVNGTLCTLSTIGHDHAGDLVGLLRRVAVAPVPRSLLWVVQTLAAWWPPTITSTTR